MSTDLAARLALLAQETPTFEDGLRVLDGGDRFAALIHLIDQTVIPARLTVSDAEGARLVMDVAGRRLCRIPGVVDTLTPEDTAAIKTAAETLSGFADRAETALRVQETVSDGAEIDPTQSISITVLSEAAGRVMIDPGAPALDQFRARLGSALIATITLSNGAETDRSGEPEALDLLAPVVDGMAALLAKGSSLTILSGGAAGVQGVAQDAEDVLIFALRGSDLDQIARAYAQSTGG